MAGKVHEVVRAMDGYAIIVTADNAPQKLPLTITFKTEKEAQEARTALIAILANATSVFTPV